MTGSHSRAGPAESSPGSNEAAAAPPIELVDATVASALSPNTPKIEGICWRIAAGDFWAVAGLPGSGKTELLATAAGLLKPLRGIHRLFGREFDQRGPDEQLQERLRIGMVYDGGARLFRNLTVAQNVALPLCYHRNYAAAEAHEAVSTLLEMMELHTVAQAPGGRISWHLRPRVGLARALVLKPEVLLLDNPLAGLDPQQADWWLATLERLVSGGDGWCQHPVTLVVSTGNLRPWSERAHQFALLKQGQWITLGGRAELASTHEPLARNLLGGAVSAG